MTSCLNIIPFHCSTYILKWNITFSTWILNLSLPYIPKTRHLSQTSTNIYKKCTRLQFCYKNLIFYDPTFYSVIMFFILSYILLWLYSLLTRKLFLQCINKKFCYFFLIHYFFFFKQKSKIRLSWTST